MEMMQDLEARLAVAEKHGFAVPEDLRKEVDELETASFRVVVVGEFQVGKTRLLNTVFLNDNPVLVEGDGRCTTAVTTELAYGEQRRLEIYRWEDENHLNEVLDKVIDNPTRAELQAFTVNREDRKEISQRISRAKLFTPNEMLKKYTILDTPGINDPDSEILFNTTYRLLPGADLAILVIPPRGLDQAAAELLKSKLVQDGICRVMVLVSYRIEDGLTSDQRDELVKEIGEDVLACGLKDCPVKMFCYNTAVSDILCSADEIALYIQNFLNNNAEDGRRQHVAEHVRKFLEKCGLELAARNKKNELSVEQIKSFELQQDSVRQQFDAFCQQINDAFEDIRQRSDARLDDRIREVFDEWISEVEDEPDLKKNQRQAEKAAVVLRPRLRDAVKDCVEELDQDIRQTMNEYNVRWQTVIRCRDGALGQLDLPVGFLGKIPPFVTFVVDVAILNLFLPMGWIVALGGKVILDRIPLLNKLSTGTVVRMTLLNNLRTVCDQLQADIVANVGQGLNKQIENICQQVQAKLREEFEGKLNVVQQGMQRPEDDREAVAAGQADIEDALRDL